MAVQSFNVKSCVYCKLLQNSSCFINISHKMPLENGSTSVDLQSDSVTVAIATSTCSVPLSYTLAANCVNLNDLICPCGCLYTRGIPNRGTDGRVS